MKIHQKLLALAGLLAALLPGQALATWSVVVTWNEAALQEVRLGRLGPPIVARALAIAHTCMYDAWAAYDPVAQPVASTVPRRPAHEVTDHNKNKAVSFAAYRCLVNLFPAGEARLAAQMRQLGYDPYDTQTWNLTYGAGVGNAAAAAVIASRRFDGSNQYGDLAPGAYADYTGYAARNAPMPFCQPDQPGNCNLNVSNPFTWQPLVGPTGVVQTFIAPHWSNVRPFALSGSDQFDSLPDVVNGPNYLRNPAAYQADVDQMVAISAALTPQQKLIVEYWADGPDSELPPGHWGLFAQHVARRDWNPATSLDRDVKMFFAMHNASFDAGIVAWHLKRKFDGVRPITAVRVNKKGKVIRAWGGVGKPIKNIDGDKWSPYNPGSNLSPAFPGWISGHSTFSAASATVLRSFTGSDNFGFSTTVPANFGRVEPGVPAVPTTLTYPTFSAAVFDAGISRLYGGIHFTDDNTVGQMLGNLTGQQAYDAARFLWEGGLTAAAGSAVASRFASSMSWMHAVPEGNNRLLMVGVATTNNNPVRAVSYAGQPMQLLGAVVDWSGDNRIEMWYLPSPPVGSNAVWVQLRSYTDVVAGASNFFGVNQAQPFGQLRSAAATTSAACILLADEPAPLVASFIAANGDARGISAVSPRKAQWTALSDTLVTGASDVYGIGSAGPATPGEDVCHQLGTARRWSGLAVPLRPAYPR